jgi:hypothetical protein
MIVAFVIVLISGVFIYFGGKVNSEVHSVLDSKTFGDVNGSAIVDQTLGKVNQSYQALYWISIFLIVGMIISIFIGSYLVTTKPIFFIPYIFILIIAIVVSVGISNAYEEVAQTPMLADIYAGFIGANFILSKLPIWIAIIGIVGGIIMFARMGSKENEIYGGGYYG